MFLKIKQDWQLVNGPSLLFQLMHRIRVFVDDHKDHEELTEDAIKALWTTLQNNCYFFHPHQLITAKGTCTKIFISYHFSTISLIEDVRAGLL